MPGALVVLRQSILMRPARPGPPGRHHLSVGDQLHLDKRAIGGISFSFGRSFTTTTWRIPAFYGCAGPIQHGHILGGLEL
jgi:hypothetical protein